MKILTIIATYNEKENISSIIEEILKQDASIDILVVDDNSPDGTGEIVEQLAKENRRINFIHREGKLGLGSANVTGMRFAIEGDYDFVITIDADFSHNPDYISRFLKRVDDFDLIVCSRYVEGGGTRDWSLIRKINSKVAQILWRFILAIKTRDCCSGFKCYRVSMLKEIDLENLLSSGFAFQGELLLKCQRIGARIFEVPIVFVDRERGRSKMSLKEILETLKVIFKLRFK